MKQMFAVQTNDPSLIRCQLLRQGDALPLPGDDAVGVGFYADDDLLLTKKPPQSSPHRLESMLPQLRSPSVVAISGTSGGTFDTEALDPFRFRRWLFAMVGEVERFEELRPAIVEGLPGYLQRQIRSATDREHLFALFLRELHQRGKIDDPTLPSDEAARCLSLSIRALDELGRERGQVRPSPLAMIASNGRLLVAARRGVPLFYGLVEGLASCEACRITEQAYAKDPGDPLIRSHRRSKAVAVVTKPAVGGGFIEVPDSSTVAVGRGLDIGIASI